MRKVRGAERSRRPTSAAISRSPACGSRSRSSPAARAARARHPRSSSSAPRPTSRIDDALFKLPGAQDAGRARDRRRPGRARRGRRRRAAGRAEPGSRRSSTAARSPGSARATSASATMSGRISAVAAKVDGGKTTALRRRGLGRRVEVARRRHDVQAGVRQAAGPVDRRDRDRSDRTRATIWVGTGESWTRNSVSVGDGIYKSTDGGETWTQRGLPESERIVRIIVHPKNEQRRLRVRARQAVERLHRSRPLQDHRRRQDLVARAARARTRRPAARASRWIRRTPTS